MKRQFFLAVLVVLFTYPSVCFPSYLIQLKNGNQLVVPRYWEEGTDIKFNLRGGVVSLSKDSVRKIIPSHLTYKERAAVVDETTVQESSADGMSIIPFSKPAEIHGRGNAPVRPGGAERKRAAVDLESYREKRDQLRGKLDEARERFWRASGDKDEEAKRKAVRDVATISSQLSELTNELRRENQCQLPDWWE